LERIEHTTSTNEEERAYNKVRHIWRYVAKCERRSEHNIQEVVEELKGAAQTYPNLRRSDDTPRTKVRGISKNLTKRLMWFVLACICSS
jgi:DNA-directed RNA polymerase subunit F